MSEQYYENLSKAKFADNILQLKPNDMSWKDFYDQTIYIFNNKDDPNLQSNLQNNNMLFGLTLFGMMGLAYANRGGWGYGYRGNNWNKGGGGDWSGHNGGGFGGHGGGGFGGHRGGGRR